MEFCINLDETTFLTTLGRELGNKNFFEDIQTIQKQF